MKLKIKCKTTGSIMVSAILAVIVWIGIAQSMAMVANSNFKSIKSGRTALQAQQYADISVDRLKNINYDELDINGAHSRKKIEGISSNDWQDEVIIGAESTIAGSDDAKQRIATVHVYKVGDTLPRYTVEVPLSSQGSNRNGSDEGYHIKCGTISVAYMQRYVQNDRIPIVFDEPFEHACIGVVLTQSYVGNDTTANLAVPAYTKNRATIVAYANERKAPISYIAFGY